MPKQKGALLRDISTPGSLMPSLPWPCRRTWRSSAMVVLRTSRGLADGPSSDCRRTIHTQTLPYHSLASLTGAAPPAPATRRWPRRQRLVVERGHHDRARGPYCGSDSVSFLMTACRACGTSVLPTACTSCGTDWPKKSADDQYTLPNRCTTGSCAAPQQRSHSMQWVSSLTGVWPAPRWAAGARHLLVDHVDLLEELFVQVRLEQLVVEHEQAAQADVALAMVRLVGLACTGQLEANGAHAAS